MGCGGSKTTSYSLFEESKVGSIKVKNRVVMAAMTRCRADPTTGVPNDLHVQYYSERAEDAAFVLTECTAISSRGNCYPGACGIWSEEQVDGWKKVIDDVHKKNGKIILQIWHCGRVAKAYMLGGQEPIGPSAIKCRATARGPEGQDDEYDMPLEMNKEDMQIVLNEFKVGAKNAKAAGFDGIQLHGANGYIIDQYLRDCTNTRTDEYGGSVENRCRFPLEVMDVLIKEFSADKVGIKITPVGRFNDMFDSDPIATFSYFIKELNKRKVAFIELCKAPEFVPVPNLYGVNGEDQIPNPFETFRNIYSGTLIANNKITVESATQLVESGIVEMVSFARYYISNPDLVVRLKNKYPLADSDYTTYYGPGAKGYTDYPKYKSSQI